MSYLNFDQQRPNSDQLHEARTQYRELEWRLNFLRTLSASKDPEPTNEEIIKWHQQKQSLRNSP